MPNLSFDQIKATLLALDEAMQSLADNAPKMVRKHPGRRDSLNALYHAMSGAKRGIRQGCGLEVMGQIIDDLNLDLTDEEKAQYAQHVAPWEKVWKREEGA